MFSRVIVLILSFAAACAANATWADTFPDRPITIVVPSTAGSSLELQSRLIGDFIQRKYGQPFVIDAKPGAMGVLGATTVARAKPDGYTLLVSPNSPLVFNQLTHLNLGYDPTAFVPVTMLSSQPLVMGVRGDFPANTMADFITWAKAHPDKINYGSQGIGGGNHMAVLLLEKYTGTSMVHVPFTGAEPATQALLQGSVDLFMAPLANILPWYRDRKLKMLAVGGAQRSPDAPDVPTFRELGYPDDFILTVWFAYVAPSGTPPVIVDWLNKAINEAMRDPSIAEKFHAMGTEPASTTPEQAAQFIDRERRLWERVANENGIKKE